MAKTQVKKDIIREEIVKYMENKGISVAEVVDVTGLARNGVYDYIAGKRSMHTENASKMLEYVRKARGK